MDDAHPSGSFSSCGSRTKSTRTFQLLGRRVEVAKPSRSQGASAGPAAAASFKSSARSTPRRRAISISSRTARGANPSRSPTLRQASQGRRPGRLKLLFQRRGQRFAGGHQRVPNGVLGDLVPGLSSDGGHAGGRCDRASNRCDLVHHHIGAQARAAATTGAAVLLQHNRRAGVGGRRNVVAGSGGDKRSVAARRGHQRPSW